MATKRIFTKNAAYQKFEVLKTNRKKRHKYNEFIIEGVRNINEATRNNWQINSFIYSHEKQLSQWAVDVINNNNTKCNYELTDSLMIELSGKDDTSELMAIVSMKNNTEDKRAFSANPVLALFDTPSNKGNLGTFFRSCDAFGVEQIIITGHSVDVYDPEVIVSSMGSFFNVPFINLSDNTDIDGYIASLKQLYPQLLIIGTTAHDKTPLYEINMTAPILFLIGNETNGLNSHLTEISDVLATIPMSVNSGASSFNVSCAATVMFYEANRQRNKHQAGV